MAVPRWIFWYRGVLVCPPLILAFFLSWHEVEAAYILWPFGIFICLLGLAVRIWAEQHINRKEGAAKKHLAISGPYKLIRNPLYVGNTLLCVGATVVSELLWMAPVTLVWCVAVYSLVIRNEEATLLEKYGEPYRKYMETTPRWIPKSLALDKADFLNEYLRPAILGEIHCLVILLPFLLKEILSVCPYK